MSLPYRPIRAAIRIMWAAGLLVPAAGWALPTSGPALGALGLTLRLGPETSGAREQSASALPQFVLRWGPLMVSNGGPLASRAGEPAESGLNAELWSRERLRVSASLSLDQGRRSGDIERLRGVHDIPAHLRGRLRTGWRLHDQWEVSATWRADLAGRGTGNGLDLTLLHEWRPEFLDHTRWRVSVGLSTEWLDATRANLVYGVTDEDAGRSGLSAYRLDAGWAEARLFTHWRRELGGRWVAYGSLTASQLTGGAARSPIVQQRGGLSLNAGLGRRF